MTDRPARHLPGSFTASARPGTAADDMSDVLASIRRLIAREDGDAAGPSPHAASPWTAAAPTLRHPGPAGSPAAAQPGSAHDAVPVRADPASAQPPTSRGGPAPLFGASHPDPALGAGNDSAPLRLRPDALIPSAGTFGRPEGRLRLRSVLAANAEPVGGRGAACGEDPAGALDAGFDDWTVAGAAAVGNMQADLPADETLHDPVAALPVPPSHGAFTGAVPGECVAPASPGLSPAPSLDAADAPAERITGAPAGWAVRLSQAVSDDPKPGPAEPAAPVLAIDPAALPEPAAAPAARLADARPAPASLRGMLRAAIRQEIEGEIDRLVNGPLHRLIRAEVARAVAEVFDSAEAAGPD